MIIAVPVSCALLNKSFRFPKKVCTSAQLIIHQIVFRCGIRVRDETWPTVERFRSPINRQRRSSASTLDNLESTSDRSANVVRYTANRAMVTFRYREAFPLDIPTPALCKQRNGIDQRRITSEMNIVSLAQLRLPSNAPPASNSRPRVVEFGGPATVAAPSR